MAAFTHKFLLELSEKVQVGNTKKHKKVGEVQVPTPILADFGINAAQYVYTAEDAKKDSKLKEGEKAFDAGIPVYAEGMYDWLQSAIIFKISASARNKFNKGELKAGMELAQDFEMLTAATARTGEALALRREAKVAFEQYLQAKGRKASTVAMLGNLFNDSAKVLTSAGDKYVAALTGYVAEWVPTLTPEQAARFAPKLVELQDSINAATKADDLDEDDLMPDSMKEQAAEPEAAAGATA